MEYHSKKKNEETNTNICNNDIYYVSKSLVSSKIVHDEHEIEQTDFEQKQSEYGVYVPRFMPPDIPSAP